MSSLMSYRINKSQRIIITLILVDAALLLILILFPEFLKKILHDEGYKELWGISLAVIGGGFISMAFANLKREQESRETTRQHLRTFFSRALSEYNKVKKW